MSGRQTSLEKQLGVCPVGVGEIWRRFSAKCVLKVTGPESTTVCQDDHMFALLKAVIDENVHGDQSIWDANSSTDNCIFLLVDANKDFNVINFIGMISTLFYSWTSRVCFIFNCLGHWSFLILQNRNGTSRFLSNREGMTQ